MPSADTNARTFSLQIPADMFSKIGVDAGNTESLDHEVRRFGIRVISVQPGVTGTAFEENLTRADRPIPTYAQDRARSEGLMREWVETGDDPQVVADTVVKAATATKPSLRYPAGKQSSQVSMLRRFHQRARVHQADALLVLHRA